MRVGEMPIRYNFRISVLIVLALVILYPLMMSSITISQPPKPPTTTTIIERDVYRIEIHHPSYALIGDEIRIWGSVELICPANVTRLDVRRFRVVLANGRPLYILYERGTLWANLSEFYPEYPLINISIVVSASNEEIEQGTVLNVPSTGILEVYLLKDPFRIYTEEYGYYLLLDLRNITLPSGARKKYTFEVSFEVLGQVLIAYDTRLWQVIEEPGEGEGLAVGFVMYVGGEVVSIEMLFPVVVGEVQALIKGLQEEKSRLLEENTRLQAVTEKLQEEKNRLQEENTRLQEKLCELTNRLNALNTMYGTIVLILLILLVIALIVVARKYGH